MAEGFYPHLYVTGIQKGEYVPPYAFIKARVFVASAPVDRAFLKPRVFVSGIDEREFATADTLRQVENPSWAGSETAIADTSRRLLDVVTADTLRIILQRETACADTLIRRPHELRYTIQTAPKSKSKAKFSAPSSSLVNSFKDYGITNFEISLNERTLSDTFSLETAKPLAINDAVKGQILDYPFSFLVEETSQQGLVQTVKGMYDIDKLLYTHVYESSDVIEASSSYQTISSSEGYTVIEDSTSTPTASEYLAQIANYFSLTPNVKIQNFTSSRDLTDANITYSDLISSLFSWTSQLPQRQINVFIRGGTLHCIQRGMESSTFDISDLPHSRPTINRKLIRTMWKNANADGNDYSDEGERERPFSGSIFYSDWYSSNEIYYRNGLLLKERSSTSNSKVAATNSTTYEYFSQQEKTGSSDDEETKTERVYYLKSKHTESSTIEDDSVEVIDVGYPDHRKSTKIVTTNDVSYVYSSRDDSGGLYIRKEYEVSAKFEYSFKGTTWKLDDKEVNDRQTFHTPAGNGWYATTVYVNGVPQGSTLSQGAPSNEVSLYTVRKMQSSIRVNVEKTGNFDLSPIDDTVFPIEETEIRQELVAALKWLNRKTQETVSVDIIDKIVNGVPTINHVVDFTERVKFNGNVYFLVSNQIRFTPRSLIQKLQLVRWY